MSKRVLLKLSGESLSGEGQSINEKSLNRTAAEIKAAFAASVIELAIVIGAGNIWRGAGKTVERVTADKMGMIATVMNALALGDALKNAGLKTKVFCARGVSGFAKDFDRDEVLRCIKKGYIIIFAGGTGNPYFTTDTTAALRAAEIKAEVLLKATQVDGIYDDDPKKNKDAVKFDKLTFKEAIEKNLKIMDTEAFSLCMHTGIYISVFDFYRDGNFRKILNGEKIGTIVT